ncbi:MAG: DinB family protein [Dehalococcoidia bacterium]|nr:MAG: DinB family protein [Dehalococcoidia bacterium]
MTAEDPRMRVRGYLLAQAEKNDFAALWPKVMEQRGALLAAFAEFSEVQAAFRPSSGEGEGVWGAADLAQHLAASTRNVMGIVEALARGTDAPEDPIGTLGDSPYGSFVEARKALFDVSLEFAALTGRLPASPDLDMTVEHAFFGPLNCRAWFLFQRVHDTDHINQLAALRATEGFPA